MKQKTETTDKQQMITPKIDALFQFIAYLHSNIENFNRYNKLIGELELLRNERRKLKPNENFKDKLRYDEVQAKIKSKNQTLQNNTANLIKSKAIELDVCNFENAPLYSFNGVESEIHQLKENFNMEYLPEILEHKRQYIEYRTKAHKTFLSLDFFFRDLDEVLKGLFDYFKEAEHNEDEVFDDLIKEINSTMEGKSFDEKVNWFEQNRTRTERTYGTNEGKHIEFEINGETFFAYSFASYKKDNPNITIAKFIKFQIEHLKGVIRRAEGKSTMDGDTPEKMVHRRELLSYFESLPHSNEAQNVQFAEDLTDENLEKYNFPKDMIDRIRTWENYQCFYSPSVGEYVCANNKENKIYTGLEAYRRLYFKSENQIDFPYECFPLMQEYYRVLHKKWEEQDIKQCKNTGAEFDVTESEKSFLTTQVDLAKKGIEVYTDKNDPRQRHISLQLNKYLSWLEIKSLSLHENVIAAKLIGLIGNHNTSNTVQPVYHHIKKVLNEYKITPTEGKEILLQMQGSFSPEWNTNVTPHIVKYLNQISLPVSPTKTNNVIGNFVMPRSRYYSDQDFNAVIDEILQKLMVEVTDFLEYHFSQAFVSNSMSRSNWLLSLKKNLMLRYEPPTDISTISYTPAPLANTPDQINLAFLWIHNKDIQLSHETDDGVAMEMVKGIEARKAAMKKSEKETDQQNDIPFPKKVKEDEIKTLPEPKLSFEAEINEIKKMENKFWKGFPMERVIEHFLPLSTRKNKNGDLYLTQEQFILFIKKAFLKLETTEKQKINCTSGEKGFVISLFYDFFTLAASQYSHPNKKAKFISLFIDCFDNWDDTESIKSFFKPGKSKEKW